jgi:hypothetical protein
MNTPSTSTTREPLFPLPFTREQIREDVCNIYLFEARKAVHLYGAMQSEPYPTFLDGLSFSTWFDQDHGPKELELSYDKVSQYDFAMAMEDFFDLGFYAVLYSRVEPMEMDTSYTWIAYYLQDCTKSAYLEEWEAYGATILDSIKRCLYVCELANARCILEGKEAFAYLRSTKDEEGNYADLSIRCLAMLAGMEELSLRSAISRKTAPVLEIKKDDRRTFIESEVARNWLIAKGRYQPVITGHLSAEIDLAKAHYNSIDDFVNMLFDRLAFVGEKDADHDALRQSMRNLLKPQKIEDLRDMQFDDLCNESLMDSIAELLDLPAELLRVRAREAALKSRISRCEWELKQLTKA